MQAKRGIDVVLSGEFESIRVAYLGTDRISGDPRDLRRYAQPRTEHGRDLRESLRERNDRSPEVNTMAGKTSRSRRRSQRRPPPSGSLRRRPDRGRRSPSRPASPRSRPSSQAATLRSRKPAATPPCRPTSPPCPAGNATSGAASTRSSCAPSPTCARPSSGTRPSMASRARAGSSTSIAHEARQSGVLPRHVAAPCPTRRVQAQGRALPRHSRERPGRRGARGELDSAGVGAARLDPVAPAGFPPATSIWTDVACDDQEIIRRAGLKPGPDVQTQVNPRGLGNWLRSLTLHRDRNPAP
jgi:hypothetical protein